MDRLGLEPRTSRVRTGCCLPFELAIRILQNIVPVGTVLGGGIQHVHKLVSDDRLGFIPREWPKAAELSAQLTKDAFGYYKYSRHNLASLVGFEPTVFLLERQVTLATSPQGLNHGGE